MKQRGRGQAKRLTDIEKLKWNPRGSDVQRHWDAVQPGLCVQVYPVPADRRQTGRRAFYVRFTQDGKQRFKKLGDWPQMSLDVARTRAGEIRAKVEMGDSPEPTNTVTVRELWEQIQKGSAYSRLAQNTRINARISFNNHVTFEHKLVEEVTDVDWRAAIRKLTDENKHGAAKLLKALSGTFYKYARKDERFTKLKNPLQGESFDFTPAKEKEPLGLDQLRSMSLNSEEANAILQMLIHTGQRISEVLRMRWDHIENDVWVVGKKGEMKRKGSAHHLPMTQTMYDIIEPMKKYGSVWVFPGRDLRYPITYRGFSLHLKKAYPDVSPHILRHSFTTLAADHSIDMYGVALVLHHTIPGMTHGIYAKSHFLGQKRGILEQIQNLLLPVDAV